MYAAIDVGTNSVRLLVANIMDDRINPLYRGLKTTRLGEGVGKQHFLLEIAMLRTVKALEEFMDTLKAFQVKKIRAVATSAVREATNSHELVKKIQSLGLRLDVISGEEEAWLSYYGATSMFKEFFHPFVIDIGGGSTELIYCSSGGQIFNTSIGAGAVRCTEEGWSKEQIKSAFAPALEKVIFIPTKNLVGVGGTITTLAAIDQKLLSYDPKLIQGYTLTLARIQAIWHELSVLPLEQRRLVPGLQPNRADIILAGIEILLTIMTQLKVDTITVSESDLLEGIIFELGK